MESLGYYNGKIDTLENMTVPMLDRANYFGDAVYEAAYSAGGVIFCLDEHIERLYRSAAHLDIPVFHTPTELKTLLRQLTSRLDGPELLVYWQISRGAARRKHSYPVGSAPNLWVMIEPGKIKPPNTDYTLVTAEDKRHLLCTIKTINLAANVLASEEAVKNGCDEAVFYHNGMVTECAKSNIAILTAGTFRTAPTDANILPGISRANLLKACRTLGIPAAEQSFSLPDMMGADEVIVCSSGTLCAAARKIDGQAVGGRDDGTLSLLRRQVYDRFFQDTGADCAGYFA
jgi:D-alanine transaminase